MTDTAAPTPAPVNAQLRDYVVQARERTAQLAELLPKAQLGGSHAVDVYALLRSLQANLDSALTEVDPSAFPTA